MWRGAGSGGGGGGCAGRGGCCGVRGGASPSPRRLLQRREATTRLELPFEENPQGVEELALSDAAAERSVPEGGGGVLSLSDRPEVAASALEGVVSVWHTHPRTSFPCVPGDTSRCSLSAVPQMTSGENMGL